MLSKQVILGDDPNTQFKNIPGITVLSKFCRTEARIVRIRRGIRGRAFKALSDSTEAWFRVLGFRF